jgi:hypothetical protein
MKYILMMNTMRAGHGVPQWDQKDLQAHFAFMIGLNNPATSSLLSGNTLMSTLAASLCHRGESVGGAGSRWDAVEPIEVRPIMSVPPPEML